MKPGLGLFYHSEGVKIITEKNLPIYLHPTPLPLQAFFPIKKKERKTNHDFSKSYYLKEPESHGIWPRETIQILAIRGL